MKNNYIVQAWLILILAVCYGGVLAGMQLSLAPIIAENKINETRQQVPELVLGSEKAGTQLEIEPQTVTIEKGGKNISYTVFKASKDGKTIGWVAKNKGQGYADKVELLLGLNPKADAITGLFILDQKETPGLGNKIIDSSWRKQFLGKKTDINLAVVKTGAKAPNEIDAITGATISSRTVCNIINVAVTDLKEPLSKK